MFKIIIARVQMKLQVTKAEQICREYSSALISDLLILGSKVCYYTFKDNIKQLRQKKSSSFNCSPPNI